MRNTSSFIFMIAIVMVAIAIWSLVAGIKIGEHRSKQTTSKTTVESIKADTIVLIIKKK